MKKNLGSLTVVVCLGSVSVASIAESHLLTEPQMDAVSAGAKPSFAPGHVLATLNARGASAREHAPALAQLWATAPLNAQGAANGVPEVTSVVAGDSANRAGAKPAVAAESVRTLGPAAAPAAGGNMLRTTMAPMNSPRSMSSAGSSLP